MSTIFKLIIEDDEGKTTVYPLNDGEVSIGRKDGNTIRLMERNVSRRHARLIRDDEAVFVEDLDSYNGVRINGERIGARFRVREGDLIEIGDYHLALQRSVPTADVGTEPADEKEGRASWPAGTLPDFPLPDDLLGDAELSDDRRSSPSSRLPDLERQPARNGAFEASLDMARAATISDRPTDRPGPDQGAPGFAPGDESSLPPFPSVGPGQPADVLSAPPAQRAETLVQGPGRADPAGPRRQPGPSLRAEFPRIICVNTEFAGREFLLDRDEMIIGRVEDNDIVVEHPSVSRNHAKVRFDGRAYRIIDLQSANGILINGEDYAMTNLRAGDLIELGNVCFRFVPAGEPFEATKEEASEMRANGIEPPSSANQLPPPGSPFDPSTAATITDAPRSALPAEPSPTIEPTTETLPPAPAARPQQSILDDRVATERSPAPVAAAARSAVDGAADAASVPTADLNAFAGRSVASTARGPGYRPMMLGLIAALAILVSVLLFFLLVDRGDARFDRRLEELYNQGNYGEVLAYYEENEGRFAQPAKAGILLGRAEARLERSDPAAAAPRLLGRMNDETVADPDEQTAPSTAPEAPTAPEDPAADPPAAVAGSDAVRRAPAARASRASSKAVSKLSRLGRNALIAGDLAKAERYLTECVKLEPDFAPCHRSLGILYGNKQDNERSARHYRRYIELEPQAADADRVRSMLDDLLAGSGT